ncbi:MAG: alpha-amylase family glycosyl hydrolase, partial [Candidatus Bathyarchaeota archaeon]
MVLKTELFIPSKNNPWKMLLGANLSNNSAMFRVWAPKAKKIKLKTQTPEKKEINMEYTRDGMFHTTVDDLTEGIRYSYSVNDGKDLPDPLSRFQPEGVHGPSAIVNPNSFHWQDKNWAGISLGDFIIYELHVGTFTREGTFESIIPHIGYLKDELGITAVELMPIAQFPGTRNWGYDGVNLYAPQNSYGGPRGLKRLVNELHKNRLAVILDVV